MGRLTRRSGHFYLPFRHSELSSAHFDLAERLTRARTRKASCPHAFHADKGILARNSTQPRPR